MMVDNLPKPRSVDAQNTTSCQRRPLPEALRSAIQNHPLTLSKQSVNVFSTSCISIAEKQVISYHSVPATSRILSAFFQGFRYYCY
jgi:hypothetical protein